MMAMDVMDVDGRILSIYEAKNYEDQ